MQVAVHGGGGRGKARRKMKVSQPAEGRPVQRVKGLKENFQTSEVRTAPSFTIHNCK